jgi:hypothetical protein
MKKLLILTTLLFAAPAIAKPNTFTYETACAVENGNSYEQDVCKVIETREPGGALRTRNVFSNRFSLTVKSRFDPVKGFVTWDSHNKFEYKWEYKVAGSGWSYIMPGVMLENVSWD